MRYSVTFWIAVMRNDVYPRFLKISHKSDCNTRNSVSQYRSGSFFRSFRSKAVRNIRGFGVCQENAVTFPIRSIFPSFTMIAPLIKCVANTGFRFSRRTRAIDSFCSGSPS